MKFARLTLAVAIAYLLCLGSAMAEERALKKQIEEMRLEKRVALVVGNSAYKDAPLKNPINDARAVARELEALGFEVMKVENADQKTMKRVMDEFGNRIRNGGVGLFYYAGHGMQVKGNNYLIPANSTINNEEDVEYESVDVNRVLERMELAGNRLNIVILDACRNNPFARSFRSQTKGLATVDAPRGTFIAYSTAPGSVAADSAGSGENSVFTEEFIGAIRKEGLEIEKVFKVVRVEVMRRSNNAQVPWQSSSLVGDFYFNLPDDDDKPGSSELLAKGRVETESNKSTGKVEGTLGIKSNPSEASLYLNGELRGHTPIKLTLPPGRYELALKKVGYLDQNEVVLMRSGRALELNLIMDKSEGGISITSEPSGANIYIGGTLFGQTPDVIKDLPPSRYRVELRKPGYREHICSVEVAAGQLASLNITLEKAKVEKSALVEAGLRVAESMVLVKGSCYIMGDSFGDGYADEKPAHQVCVSDFFIGKNEVTVREFMEFVKATNFKTDAEHGAGCVGWTGTAWQVIAKVNWKNPGFPQLDNYPVSCISWNDAQAYIKWKSREDGVAYRLPTEAEWEYAAKSGGIECKYSWCSDSPGGNVADEAAKKAFSGWSIWEGYDDGFAYAAPVASFAPSGLGIYDMTGNVWEWCSDWYSANYYSKSPKDNPPGPVSGIGRVIRGGSWSNHSQGLRTSFRVKVSPGYGNINLGFRLARTP